MRVFFFQFVLLFTIVVRADFWGYNQRGFEQIESYMKEILKSPAASVETVPNKCMNLYQEILNKGEMEIRYAFGYLDVATGKEQFWKNKNFGYSPSVDFGLFNSLRSQMTKKCKSGNSLILCGFSQKGDPNSGKVVLEKKIPFLSKEINVKLILTHASASDIADINQTKLAKRQKFLTAQSEENFFDGIGKADIIIYNGHSRKGGGPDFAPPVLTSDYHTDYDGYYRVKKTGITKVLEAIRSGSNKDSILGFFSCDSKKHFYKDIMDANPQQRLILTEDTVYFLDILRASAGYLEGFMRGKCGQDLADFAKQGQLIKDNFQGFQIR